MVKRYCGDYMDRLSPEECYGEPPPPHSDNVNATTCFLVYVSYVESLLAFLFVFDNFDIRYFSHN